MSGAAAWVANGTGWSDTLADAVVTPGYDPSVMGAATSTCIGGVTTGCAAPVMVGTMSTIGSPVRPIIMSGTAAITDCSTTTEGAPCAPVSACPAEGPDDAVGGA